MDVIPSPPPRTARKVRLQVSLRYLVSTWSDDPAGAHKLLSDLLFAALANPDFSVEPGPIPIEMWTSLGIPPRAAFLMRVPLAKDLPERKSKYVRQVVLQTSPGTSVTGLVMGPGDVALSGALVQLPALNLAVRTDPRGRFQFSNIPAESSDQILRVSAKGREQSFRMAEHMGSDGIVRIQFQLEEV